MSFVSSPTSRGLSVTIVPQKFTMTAVPSGAMATGWQTSLSEWRVWYMCFPFGSDFGSILIPSKYSTLWMSFWRFILISSVSGLV